MNSDDVSMSYRPYDNHSTTTTPTAKTSSVPADSTTVATANDRIAVENNLENLHQAGVPYTVDKQPEIIVSNASNSNSPMSVPKHRASDKANTSSSFTNVDTVGCSDINDNTVTLEDQSLYLFDKLQHCIDDNSNHVEQLKHDGMLLSSDVGHQYTRHSSINSLSSGCSLDLTSDYSDDGEEPVSSPTTEDILKVCRFL